MLKDVKRADALAGARGNSFMQQSVARGLQAAGETVVVQEWHSWEWVLAQPEM